MNWGLKLHRSLQMCTKNFHGADKGGTTEIHTQDKSRWMQSDTFLLQQTSCTNVCNPAVRLKSMTLRSCCCNYELAAELFASMRMEKKSLRPLSLSRNRVLMQDTISRANLVNKSFSTLFQVDRNIYNYIRAQAYSALCDGSTLFYHMYVLCINSLITGEKKGPESWHVCQMSYVQ